MAASATLAGGARPRALPRTVALGPGTTMLVLAGLLGLVCLVNLNLGVIGISPTEVVATFLGRGTAQQELVLLQFRLPRIVLALLVGVGLALSGVLLQGVSRNPLADPGLLGISAGAGLGVAALLLWERAAFATWTFAFPLGALVGAGLTAVLVYGLAQKQGEVTPSRLLLVGVAVSLGIGALELLLALRMDRQVYSRLVVWLAGSLAGTTWNYPLALLPWIAVLAPLAVSRAQVLNVLNLGDAVATGLGAAVRRQRFLLLAAAVGLAASSVAVSGAIAFVGLVGPHIARRLVGPNHRVLLPTAALVGALLLVVADTLARNLFARAETPVGLVVAVIGAPYFLYLLARTRG